MTVTKQSTVLLMYAQRFFSSLSKAKEHCSSSETMWANKEKKPNFRRDCWKNTPFYTFAERIHDRRWEVKTSTITCFTCATRIIRWLRSCLYDSKNYERWGWGSLFSSLTSLTPSPSTYLPTFFVIRNEYRWKNNIFI